MGKLKRVFCVLLVLIFITAGTACKSNSEDESYYSVWEEVVLEGEQSTVQTENSSQNKTAVTKKEEASGTVSSKKANTNGQDTGSDGAFSKYYGNSEELKKGLISVEKP